MEISDDESSDEEIKNHNLSFYPAHKNSSRSLCSVTGSQLDRAKVWAYPQNQEYPNISLLPYQQAKSNEGLSNMYGGGGCGVLGTLVSLTAQVSSTAGCDFLPLDPVQREIQVREKYWGEILERTVSSHNIQASMKEDLDRNEVIPTNKDGKYSSMFPFLVDPLTNDISN